MYDRNREDLRYTCQVDFSAKKVEFVEKIYLDW